MYRLFRFIGLIALVTFAACLMPPALAQDARATKADAEFSVGRYGAHLCVPLALAPGRSGKVVIDTGAAVTVLDLRFRPATASIATCTLRTPAGDVAAELHAPPKAHIGPLDFAALRAVAYADLESLRQALGEDVVGIVGMDLLRSIALEYDPDGGRLSFWRSAPAAWSQDRRIPLHDCQGLLAVKVTFPGLPSELSLVDTGATSSTIRGEAFDSLAKRESLIVTHAQEAVTVMGSVTESAGYLRQMTLDEYELRGIRVDRGKSSVLGLRQLSRFLVRADFASRSLYLSRGARFDVPDFTATSGMSVVFVDRTILVRSVEPGGPAAKAGVRPGDLITAINGTSAGSYDRTSLAAEFTRLAGRSIDVTICRDATTLVVRVTTECRLRVAGQGTPANITNPRADP